MRINSSEINLSSSRIDVSYSSKFEYLRKWDKKSDFISQSLEENGEVILEKSEQKDRVELKVQGIENKSHNINGSEKDDSARSAIKDKIDEIWGDLRSKIIKDLVEMFTGRKIEVLDAQDITDLNDENETAEEGSDFSQESGAAPGSSLDTGRAIPVSSLPQSKKLQGWGVDYYYKETNYQKEGFQFQASGVITTDKGQQIMFNTSLQMSREKYDELTISLKEGDALIDPLIIDFSGTGASFADAKFEFDLDADGKTEMIHAPSPGTAFLAYDKNGNGVIDDGSELFGPSSGNGFNELAELDEDKNGWVDENDAAFSRLKLWEKSADGNDTVSSLLQKGVGALYTGRVETGFDLTSNDSVSAVVKETGIFLKENGESGFIQEVDIVV